MLCFSSYLKINTLKVNMYNLNYKQLISII
ncbi:glycosyltransferase family 2 protein, partial [Francisella tularensis]|nr:glycosyltransferase family 2 protein [Francisella tularensis]